MSDSKDRGEENIAKLLAHAGEPPRIRPQARERILAAVKTRRGTLLAARQRESALPHKRRVLMMGVALAAAMAFMLFVFGRERSVVHANEGAPPVSIALEDGTKVILDRGAEVVDHGGRHLRLVRGQALLDVVHTGSPFIVDAPQGRVVVTGTLLVLDARDNETRAAVARGVVRIEGSSGTELLQAGEQGVLHEGRPPTRLPAPRVSYLGSFARQAFEKDAAEGEKGATRHGALLARDPRGWAGEFPLAVRDFTVDVHVENGVARTTIDQTFFNHTSMQLEGVYSFPLPPGASIARLAMYVDGTLVEGGVVERQRGRDVYESIVYQRRDPALLEWMAGNVFKIRIFPLPARSEKRVVLSYTQTLEHLYDTYRLAVPIPQLDAPVGHARFNVDVVGGEGYDIASSTHDLAATTRGADRTLSFEKDRFTLAGDLLVTLRERAPAPVQAVRHGDYIMVRARPEWPAQAVAHKPRRWAILYDTSASRTPSDLEAQAFFATHLLAEADDADTYTLVAFDRTVRVLSGGMHPVREDASVARTFLASESRAGIGDTDLEAAVLAALEKLGPPSDASESIIAYLGDGMVTRGETRATELATRIGTTAKFVGVTVGAKSDARLMQSLAVATGGLSVSVNAGDDLSWRAFDLVATLNTTRVLDLRSTLKGEDGRELVGAIAYGPAQLSAGESAEVIARVSGAAPTRLVLAGSLEGKPWSTELPIVIAKANASYLPRLWAQRRIDALLADADPTRQKDEVTRLGLEHFLLTPYTSLLVLENDAMYKSFNVRRSEPNDWARYPAPPTIRVKVEPAEQGNASGAVDLGGSIVTRTTVVFGRAQSYGAWHVGLRETPSPDFFSTRQANLWGGDLTAEDGWKGLLEKERRSGESASWTGAFHKSAGLDVDIPTTVVTAPGATDLSTIAVGANISLDPSASRAFGSGSGLGPGIGGKFRSGWGSLGPAMEATLTGAFRYSSDPRLDDLSEAVPALFDDELDTVSGRLRASAAAGERGAIAPDARVLLDRAWGAQTSGRFTTDTGDVLVVRDGKYQRDRKLPSGLAERTVYDGESLVTSYPDLELVVTRALGAAEPALFAREVPFVLPSLTSLELSHHVELVKPRTLRLRPIGRARSSFDIELDEALRIVRIGDLRLERAGEAITARDAHGGHVTWTRLGEAGAIERASDAFVHVTMPLRDEGHWLGRMQTLEAGGTGWMDAQRQLLATYAARGNEGALAATLRSMHERTGALSRGDLVLGSRAARQLDTATLRRLTGSATDPVAAFLVATRAFHENGSTAAIERVAAAHPKTPAGMLARYRALLVSVEREAGEPEQRARLTAFGREYPEPTLRLVAAIDMTQRWSDAKAIGAVWDELARDPAIGWRADAAAAQVLRTRGAHEQAAPRYLRAFFGALDAGEHPSIDPNFRWVLTSYTGEAGYRSFWARWRSRVLASKDPRALLSFLQALANGGEEGDLSHALAAYEALEGDDADVRAALVTQLSNAGRTAEAWAVLGHARSGDARTYMLAATVAEREVRLTDAARLTVRAMDALGAEPIGLGALRASYQHLFDLYRRVVLGARSDEETRWAVAGTLDAAARWRRDDPDNAAIDKGCANILFDARRPADALRYLASITERHSADGASYADVAEVLERRGEDADELWGRAFEVEPTNPTWLMRRAQNILAQGGPTSRVRPLLDQIERGKWQDRFINVQVQARRLLQALPQQ